jgi:Cys-rich protein (TIGR01571 family)
MNTQQQQPSYSEAYAPQMYQPYYSYFPNSHAPLVHQDARVEVDAVNGVLPKKTWSTGICDCTKDAESCMYSFCTGSCGVASSFARVTNTNWCTACCLATLVPHTANMVFRYESREAYGIEGDILNDFCTGLWCGPCSTAQIWREAKLRGPAPKRTMN